MHVERELQELRDRLAQVDEWKRRREEIDQELAQVWVESAAAAADDDNDGKESQPLAPPPYAATPEAAKQTEGGVAPAQAEEPQPRTQPETGAEKVVAASVPEEQAGATGEAIAGFEVGEIDSQ